LTEIPPNAKKTKTDNMAAPTSTDVINTGLFGTSLDAKHRKELGFIGFDGKDAEFCPYTDTSKNYDKTRRPLGIPTTLGAMALNAPLREQALLDVGAGTGTFLEEVCPKFMKCVGLEYNDGMIAEATKRFGADSNVKFMQGSADSLPFEDCSFNAVTMNQVSHHFPVDDNYAFLARVLKEIYRVLSSGGCFIMNHQQRCQVVHGMWWTALMPKTCEQYCKQTCPTDLLLQYMRDAGFEVSMESCVVPTQGTLMGENVYLNKYGGLEGAFVKEYRDGDSSWVMAETLGELESAQQKIRTMQADGTADAFLKEREEARMLAGQASFICVYKPHDKCVTHWGA